MSTSKCSYTGNRVALVLRDGGGRGSVKVTMGTLPDDILIEVFAFYVEEAKLTEQWHTLVHVCRRWRQVVFSYPCLLHLRLLCTEKTPVREMLDIWPALPIIIWNSGDPVSLVDGADNIIAALEHRDRVHSISLWSVPTCLLERFTSAMEQPFPALTSLVLLPSGNSALSPIRPDPFLGSPGTAPRLQTLWLEFIPFPAIRKLYISAGDLVHLRLMKIPHSGYISPAVMVTCLSSLTQLQSLFLGLDSPLSRPRPGREGRRLPPRTRTILPALTSLGFQGASEYLEDLLSGIDVPLVDEVNITFFNQLIWDTPQLLQFINRAKKLRSPNYAELSFYKHSAVVKLSSQTGKVDCPTLTLRISCEALDWQLSSLAQVCDLSFPTLSTLESLDICEAQEWQPQNDMENAQWLETLYPFTSVKDLHLSKELGLYVAPALRELTRETVTGVLPALRNLFLEGFQPSGVVPEAFRQFVAARQLLVHSFSIHRLEMDKECNRLFDGR